MGGETAFITTRYFVPSIVPVKQDPPRPHQNLNSISWNSKAERHRMDGWR